MATSHNARDHNASAPGLSRRDLIAAGLGLSGVLVLGGSHALAQPAPVTALAPAGAAPGPQSRRLLRIAHFTDTHIQPELGAADGVAAAFAHVQSLADKPDLIVHTGDIIFDGFAAQRDRTATQWALWKSSLKNVSIPVQHALGNHDIWGWNRTRSVATGNEPDFGKKWACDQLGLARPYHSFDKSGWHFIALDSVRPYGENAYTAFLDDEQFDWLAADLAATPAGTPVCVLSHIPLVSVTSYINTAPDPAATQPAAPSLGRYRPDRGDIVIGGAVHHGDFRRLKTLFAKHPNVRMALSGHTHLIDRVDYNNVSYLCGGAISAAWWKGLHQNECDFGYSLIDLYADGTFSRQYTPYGWTARA